MGIVRDTREQAGYAFDGSRYASVTVGREPPMGDFTLIWSFLRQYVEGTRERLSAIVKASDAARPVQ